MVPVRMLAAAVLALGGAAAGAAERVGVPGSSTTYPAYLEAAGGGKTIRFNLTGVALRKKLVFNVYTIGSYLVEGTAVRTAEDLAAADSLKSLHLVMERTVEGKDMASAFETAIRQNYPAPAFEAEVGQLVQLMNAHNAEKGDYIVLTHTPGVGLRCLMPGKVDFTIKNPQFSKAVWDVYLGRNNLGEAIKKGLVSRL